MIQPKRHNPRDVRRQPRRYLLIVGVAICAVLSVAVWFVGSRQAEVSETPKTEQKRKSKPKPIVAPPPAVQVKPAPQKPPADDDTYRDAQGILRYKGSNIRAVDPTRPTRRINLNVGADGKPLYKPSPFKNRAEKEIYRLISSEPGQMLFGVRRYDERFEADYLRSLETPIVITKDDDEETAAAKKAMNEVKIEINDRMRAGESLAQILDETRSELRRLAEIKRMVKSDILESAKGTVSTEEDAEDLIKAANILLENKGIAPLKDTTMLRKSLMLRSKGTKE